LPTPNASAVLIIPIKLLIKLGFSTTQTNVLDLKIETLLAFSLKDGFDIFTAGF